MQTAKRCRYSFEEYLNLEVMSNVRHEFFEGEIFAMAGGTPEHARTCANLIALLANALTGRPCTVYTSDARVRIRASGLDTYPDVSVVCGPIETDEVDRHAIANPTVLVEVTSPSTAAYDRGEKLVQYKSIPKLREIAIVAHDAKRIDVWRRADVGAWDVASVGPGQVVRLESLNVSVPVDAVYRDPLA